MPKPKVNSCDNCARLRAELDALLASIRAYQRGAYEQGWKDGRCAGSNADWEPGSGFRYPDAPKEEPWPPTS